MLAFIEPSYARLMDTYVLVVPNLAQDSVASVRRVLASISSIEPGSRATQERNTAVLLVQNIYKIGVRVHG